MPAYKIRLGDLAGRIQAFHEMRATLIQPDFADWFNRALYATYLSYVPPAARRYSLRIKVRRSRQPGGIHQARALWADICLKNQAWNHARESLSPHQDGEVLVVEGDGLIRMRAIEGGPVEEYSVTGSAYQVIDIPPGLRTPLPM